MNVNLLTNNVSTNMNGTKQINPHEAQKKFAGLLKDAINKVNDLQVQSDIMTEKLAKGENVELHNVMIAAEKASITLNAAIEIRNKAVEAYQEIMRMQI